MNFRGENDKAETTTALAASNIINESINIGQNKVNEVDSRASPFCCSSQHHAMPTQCCNCNRSEKSPTTFEALAAGYSTALEFVRNSRALQTCGGQ